MSSNQRGPDLVAPSYGVTWGGLPMYARRAMTVGLATLVAAGVAGPATARRRRPRRPTRCRSSSASSPAPGTPRSSAVASYGGEVVRALDIINGFTAEVPADRLDALRAVPGVESVTEDAGLALSQRRRRRRRRPSRLALTLANEVTGASDLWDAGLHRPRRRRGGHRLGRRPGRRSRRPRQGRLWPGPDPRGRNGPAKNLDTYGHGTHMAGIIAGRDASATHGERELRRTSSASRRTPGSSASRSLTPRARPTSPRPSRPSTGSSRTATRTA